jgi:Protein of unknown function (DUF3102)
MVNAVQQTCKAAAEAVEIAEPAAEVLPAQPIPEAEIRALEERHRQLIQVAATALIQAFEIGAILCNWKTRIPHGQWLPWVRANLNIAERTVSQYIRLSESREILERYFKIGRYFPANRAKPICKSAETHADLKSAEAHADLEQLPSIQKALFFLSNGQDTGAQPKPKPAKGPRYPKLTLTPDLLNQLCPDCRAIVEGKPL